MSQLILPGGSSRLAMVSGSLREGHPEHSNTQSRILVFLSTAILFLICYFGLSGSARAGHEASKIIDRIGDVSCHVHPFLPHPCLFWVFRPREKPPDEIARHSRSWYGAAKLCVWPLLRALPLRTKKAFPYGPCAMLRDRSGGTMSSMYTRAIPLRPKFYPAVKFNI